MSIILNIETSSTNCSVSISDGAKIISLKEENFEKYSHSKSLHVFIDELFKKIKLSPNDLSAVAISEGPGSYTGARLAYTFLSTLKLITEKDFLAYSNLTALAWGKSDKVPVIKGNKNDFYYQKNNKEIYAANINTFDEKLSFVSTEPISEIENLEILPDNIIAKNIVDMVSEGANHLTSNQPNYIKELQYRKLNG